ncbi:MAG: family 43 glycosylhydrolase [Oscillospiraceae bacterium]
MNPLLPLSEYTPDVEARVFSDGKIYLYGSHDILGNTEYCSREYYVFSSEDFMNWNRSPISFCVDEEQKYPSFGKGLLYAPDCVEKDGVYYLYFCMEDGTEGVAESNSPVGPFLNPKPVVGADKKGIDPSVFIDDDGTTYFYWGQFHLQGAKLSADMTYIQENTLCKNILSEKEHGFHEGASMRKYKGTYYLLYTDISRGRATCISYAVSERPLGPFKKGGVIIDNNGCDPDTWNNHGSMEEINGEWYVFYHRATQKSKYSRRVCVEPIFFDESGNIREIDMSLKGQEDVIKAKRKIEASRASKLSGRLYVSSYYEVGLYKECLSNIHSGDWCEYRSLDFAKPQKCYVEAGSGAYGGEIEVHIDSPKGILLGIIEIKRTGEWRKFEEFSVDMQLVEGEHILYLVFKGIQGRLFDLNAIWFA